VDHPVPNWKCRIGATRSWVESHPLRRFPVTNPAAPAPRTDSPRHQLTPTIRPRVRMAAELRCASFPPRIAFQQGVQQRPHHGGHCSQSRHAVPPRTGQESGDRRVRICRGGGARRRVVRPLCPRGTSRSWRTLAGARSWSRCGMVRRNHRARACRLRLSFGRRQCGSESATVIQAQYCNEGPVVRVDLVSASRTGPARPF
jgi:hypothetical protein